MDELSLKGWIKLYRKVMDSKLWFVEPFSKAQAWIDLLLLANHSDNSYSARGILITVKRGQLAYSQKTLASRWKWSRKKVANFLKYLEMEHQIEHQNTNLTTIITIVNYEEYQQGEHQTEHQRNTKRTPEEHQRNTNNNDKNEEKEKNEKKLNISPEAKKAVEYYMTTKYYPQRKDWNNQAVRDRAVRSCQKLIDEIGLDRLRAILMRAHREIPQWIEEERMKQPFKVTNFFGKEAHWCSFDGVNDADNSNGDGNLAFVTEEDFE